MTTPRKQREIWRVQSECGLTSSLDEPGLESLKEKEKISQKYLRPLSSSYNHLTERSNLSQKPFLNESNSKTIGYTIKKGNDFKYLPRKSRGKK